MNCLGVNKNNNSAIISIIFLYFSHPIRDANGPKIFGPARPASLSAKPGPKEFFTFWRPVSDRKFIENSGIIKQFFKLRTFSTIINEKVIENYTF